MAGGFRLFLLERDCAVAFLPSPFRSGVGSPRPSFLSAVGLSA